MEDVPNPEDDDPFNAPVATDDATTDDAVVEDAFAEDPFDAEPTVDNTAEDNADDVIEQTAPAPVEEEESAQLVFAKKFRAIIQERDSVEEAKRRERQESANAELDQWRSMRAEHREKTAASNRTQETEFEETRKSEKENSSSWAQIVKSIDTQASSDEDRTDAARMRSVLIQLKNNPLKPPVSAAETTAVAEE